MTEMRDVVVVGAGIAGLAAAWDLRNRDVLVLESTDRIGGRIRSEPRGAYWLNLGAHVFAGEGSASGRLIADVGVDAVTVPGRLTAMAMNGKVLTDGRVEAYPLRVPMSWADRAAIARAGAKLRVHVARYARFAQPLPGETRAETRSRLVSYMADRSFADLLGPLPADADALFRPTVTRSTAEPEQLTAGQGVAFFNLVWSSGGGLSRNIVGGSTTLIDGIARELEGRIRLSAAVEEIVQADDHVVVRLADGEVRARHAIVTTPAFEAARLIRDLPAETATALQGIPYGALLVMAILTDESGPMPYDDLYALATPKQPFNMLFNMASLQRSRSARREPGGSLFVYRAGEGARPLLELPDDAVRAEFLGALEGIYPQLHGVVRETVILRLPRGLPYPAPGRHLAQPALDRPLGRVHLAGDYLGGSYTETAIATGQDAALAVRTSLQAGVPTPVA